MLEFGFSLSSDPSRPTLARGALTHAGLHFFDHIAAIRRASLSVSMFYAQPGLPSSPTFVTREPIAGGLLICPTNERAEVSSDSLLRLGCNTGLCRD